MLAVDGKREMVYYQGFTYQGNRSLNFFGNMQEWHYNWGHYSEGQLHLFYALLCQGEKHKFNKLQKFKKQFL